MKFFCNCPAPFVGTGASWLKLCIYCAASKAAEGGKGKPEDGRERLRKVKASARFLGANSSARYGSVEYAREGASIENLSCD